MIYALLYTDGNNIWIEKVGAYDECTKLMIEEYNDFMKEVEYLEYVDVSTERVNLLHKGDLHLWEVKKM